MNSKIRILVVDNNVVSRMSTVHMLLTFQIEVMEAQNGLTALNMVETNSFDMIFMSLQMQDLSSIELLNHIRLTYGNEMPVIGTTGNKKEDVNLEITSGHIQGLLTKPINIEEMYQYLKSNLPNLKAKDIKLSEQNVTEDYLHKVFKDSFQMVHDINMDEGLYYAMGNIQQYYKLIQITIRQLKEAEQLLSVNLKSSIYHKEFHALKSTLYYIGSKNIAKQAEDMEIMLNSQGKDKETYNEKMQSRISDFIIRIHRLSNELEQAINAYNNSISKDSKHKSNQKSDISEAVDLMELILEYVNRFEYVEIFNGIQRLMEMVSKEDQPLIYQAMISVEEFDYEGISRIIHELLKKNRGEAR